MQLNGFDNFILKFPKTATNVFTDQEKEKYNTWAIVLPIVTYFLPLVGFIIALVLRSKDKESAMVNYLTNQSVWMLITSVIATITFFIPAIGGIWMLWISVIAVYGNITGKFFDLPLVGQKKLFKY